MIYHKFYKIKFFLRNFKFEIYIYIYFHPDSYTLKKVNRISKINGDGWNQKPLILLKMLIIRNFDFLIYDIYNMDKMQILINIIATLPL